MRIMFAGGGTGGHIYPAIAIAGEIVIRIPDAEILFMAGTKGMERRIIGAAGYDMVAIPAAGLPRKLSPALVPFAWKLTASIVKSLSVIRRFRPSVLIATGGYVSGAPLIASHVLGIPSVIQEQNSYPGITNRKLAGYADIVFLGFGDAERFFPAGKDIRITGNPVRKDMGTGDRGEAAKLFGLDPDVPTVLVFGGSQGSRALNGALAGAAEKIAGRGIQLLWQTGRNEFERYGTLDGSSGGRIRVVPYIDDMVSAYAAADCAITPCRGDDHRGDYCLRSSRDLRSAPDRRGESPGTHTLVLLRMPGPRS